MTLHPSLAEPEILEILDEASRRGRLPGFEARPGDGVLFRVSAYGHPVDGRLDARMERSGGEPRLSFSLSLPRRLRIILGMAMVLTVWPGVYFMDQIMIQLLPGVRAAVPTWWWYLPLSILPLPWMWRSVMRRAKSTTEEGAREAIAKIRAELGEGTETKEPTRRPGPPPRP